MDTKQYHDLLRSFSASPSRRAIIRGVSGFAVVGSLRVWLWPEKAAAKKKHRKKGKNKHKKHQSCLPEDATVTCGPPSAELACEITRTNHCGQPVVCSCADAYTCLENQSCAVVCHDHPECPSDCVCHHTDRYDILRCIPIGVTCADVPQACQSTAECPLGQQCMFTNCGPEGLEVLRCHPVCSGWSL